MRIIKHLAEQIDHEVDCVIEYAKDALEYKQSYPQLADLYYKMANSQCDFVTQLHDQILRIVDNTKREKKEVPAFMLEKWEKKHVCLMKKMAEAKSYISLYK